MLNKEKSSVNPHTTEKKQQGLSTTLRKQEGTYLCSDSFALKKGPQGKGKAREVEVKPGPAPAAAPCTSLLRGLLSAAEASGGFGGCQCALLLLLLLRQLLLQLLLLGANRARSLRCCRLCKLRTHWHDQSSGTRTAAAGQAAAVVVHTGGQEGLHGVNSL